MSHIFISYSHKDTDYAHKLAGELQDKGFAVWIDERLDYGSQWPHEIQKQLDSCFAFIVIMSPRSFASEWVQSELQRAKRKMKPVFPMLLEGDEPWLSVESTQYYDVRGGKLPDARFYSALNRLASGSQTAPVPAGTPVAASETAQVKAGSKRRLGWVLAILAVGVLFLAACVMVIAGQFISGWIDRPAAPGITETVDPSIRFEPSPTSEIVPNTGGTPTSRVIQTSRPTQTPRPAQTSRPSPTSTSRPPSGSCQDGYVHRLIKPSDKVCVPPASKAQAEADNAEAESRKILSALIDSYGVNACAYGYVWRNAFDGDVVCVEPSVRDQVQADNNAASSRWISGDYGPYTCISGYVWRGTNENDLVCVTPDQRDQAAFDNSQAESRKAINVYGENECISGYVWREAFSGDFVCVTPAVRDQTAYDNAQAPAHTWP